MFDPRPIVLALAFAPHVAPDVQGGTVDGDLTELSLEELLDIEVTTVSRKAGSVADSPAAVYVITREDIRRSGHTSLPELLRLVPGMHVARVNSSAWAISARGENGRFSDKLLVMIDGRSIYTNLFSGVFWDAHDLLLEDIERIEVIRGPGGSVWGANAVNGVINVITRSAEDTQGSYATVLAGDEDRGIVGYRYGGEWGDTGHWRAFAKWSERDETVSPLDGSDSPDPWTYRRAGTRLDWEQGDRDSFTVEGEWYSGHVRERDVLLIPDPPFDASFEGTFLTDGGHALGRWVRQVSASSDFQLQAYVDVAERESRVFDHGQTTLDVDFQHRLEVNARHELVWGLGYRWWDTHADGTVSLEMLPDQRHDDLFSAFVQDEVRLRGDDLRLIVGTKVEHNDSTGFEIQPSVRGIWRPSADQAVWASISRAVRTPSVANEDASIIVNVVPGTPSTVMVIQGSDNFESEELTAYELGYRCRPLEGLSLDVAAFYHDYKNLDSLEPGTPYFDGAHVIVPLVFDNLREGQSLGLEVASTYEVSERWRLHGSLTGMSFREDYAQESQDPFTVNGESATPDYIVHLRSYLDLADDIEFDCGLYAVDGLRVLGVRDYWRVDGRLAWHPSDSLEVSLVAQNAFDPSHREFMSELDSALSEIERSLYLQASWRH